MKTIEKKRSRHSKSSSLSGKSLELQVITTKKDKEKFSELAGKFHYMGEGHGGGDTMRIVVTSNGEWIALFLWGAAAYRLKERDEFIGWTASLRAQRQKLIVQNRRFVLLVERGKHPNLASKVLGLVLRELPDLWFKEFGYKPLLAETFSDIEAREGTCYKASGWLPLGKTKGYSRHKADFYVPNDRPKKLWVKELQKNATRILCSPTLSAEFIKGAKSDADGVMPLKMEQIMSLRMAMARVPDPRAGNRSFHISGMLSIIAMAIFSGHRDISQITRFADRIHLKHRRALLMPRYKKDSSYLKVPSYSAFYNLLKQLDVNAFSEVLSQWLLSHSGNLPQTLALDGKFIRDVVGIVCLVDHETGIPAAMTKASKKKTKDTTAN